MSVALRSPRLKSTMNRRREAAGSVHTCSRKEAKRSGAKPYGHPLRRTNEGVGEMATTAEKTFGAKEAAAKASMAPRDQPTRHAPSGASLLNLCTASAQVSALAVCPGKSCHWAPSTETRPAKGPRPRPQPGTHRIGVTTSPRPWLSSSSRSALSSPTPRAARIRSRSCRRVGARGRRRTCAACALTRSR